MPSRAGPSISAPTPSRGTLRILSLQSSSRVSISDTSLPIAESNT